MSRQQAFEAIYAKQHDVPAESLVQYRFESKEGYSLPGIASHYRFYCLAMDSEEIQELRKDAERYRFIRSSGGLVWTVIESQKKATGDLYDVGVDAAMSKGERP